MKLYWIIAGLLLLFILILLNLFGPLKGSSGSDFQDDLQPEENPLPDCPDSPNPDFSPRNFSLGKAKVMWRRKRT